MPAWKMQKKGYKKPIIFFYEESNELRDLARCVASRFENLLTSSCYFSKLIDLNLDGFAIYKQDLHAKASGKDQLDDLELDGPITLQILEWIASFAWNSTEAKR